MDAYATKLILLPTTKLMLLGDTPGYNSALPSSTHKVSFTKPPRNVGGLQTLAYLMDTIKMAFMALNLTHPEAIEACWICLQPLTPCFETFGANGSYEILDKADNL